MGLLKQGPALKHYWDDPIIKSQQESYYAGAGPPRKILGGLQPPPPLFMPMSMIVSRNQRQHWPNVEYPNIFIYFIATPIASPYMLQQLVYKSLEAYKLDGSVG